MGILQLEFYEQATAEEIKQAKSLLSKYRKMKAEAAEFERKGIDNLATNKRITYNALVKTVDEIESAVRLILDPEIRQIVEMRYIRGERHKVTVLRFSSMHPATVDRKLLEGIESVANSLKLFMD